MKFSKIVYGSAAVYGFVSLLPLYFLVSRIGRETPPPITHPEFYYGFLGVTLLWQGVFIFVANDPSRYRPLMPLAILEKLVYTVPVIILYFLGETSAKILAPSLVDPVFGVLFLIAYFRTPSAQTAATPEAQKIFSS